MKYKNKKQKRTIILLLILLGVSVGFALLSTTLKINGTAGIKSNTWNIHWENVVPNQSSTITAETPALSENNTEVTYEVELSLPGDFYEFTVDAKNDGTINGKIDEIRHTVKEVTVVDDEEVETTATLPNYILYSIYYDGTETAPQPGDILEAGKKKTYRVRIEFDRNAETLPATDKVYRITEEIDYVQTKDKESIDSCNYEPVNICQAERAQIEANPNAYRNQDQSSTNRDIGLDENCNVINLDMWTGVEIDCYDYDEEEWPERDGCKHPYKYYYISNDPTEVAGDEDITLLPDNEITLGKGQGIVTPATSSAQVVNGEVQTPIPAYILLDGKNEFYPVTRTKWIFGDENCRGRNSGNPITKMPHLPSTIHTIGEGTFINTNISEITIPKNVRTIDTAFYRIFETPISVSFEEGSKMEVLSDYAFGDSDVDLTGNLEIPMCVQVIGSNAFSYSSLSSLTFEEGSKLREIKAEAFNNSGLTGNLVLPKTVEYIGEQAFTGNNLTSVTFPSSATYFDSNSSYPSFDSSITISHQY